MLKIFLLFCLLFYSTLEIDHCSKTRSVCKTCISGYSLVETESGPECLEDAKLHEAQRIDMHCYKGSSSCSKCEKDYVLSNNRCVHSPGCKFLSSDDSQCIICNFPYTTVESVKWEKKPSCSKMYDGECSECSSYYYLSNGACKKITIDHCISVDNSDKTKCMDCEQKYHEENGVCKENPQGCNSMQSGQCINCEDGYSLENGQCKKYLDQKIAHCISHSESNTCLTCETSYKANSGTCIDLCKERQNICDTCEENYYSFDNGKTCEYIEPMKENKINYLKLNVAVISLVLSLIIT